MIRLFDNYVKSCQFSHKKLQNKNIKMRINNMDLTFYAGLNINFIKSLILHNLSNDSYNIKLFTQ